MASTLKIIGITMIKENFIQAYNNLMQHLHETLGDTDYSTATALEIAKDKTSAQGDFTEAEIEQVSGYVTRDLDHAATSLNPQSENSFSEWLKFDVDLIENFALDAFMDVADKTRLELAILEQQAKQVHIYQSGEVTGPGTFVCVNCNKEIAFKSTSHIPDCPHCQATSFVRC